MEEKEPWRIDKDSIHFKVLKGWLSERFREWLGLTAPKFNLLEDDLLTRIIETIRRISWRTFQILKERMGKEVNNFPFIIISDAPGADLGILGIAIRSGFEFLDKAEAEKKLNFFVTLFVARERISQISREIKDEPRSFGNAGEIGIAIYDQPIMIFFNSAYSYIFKKSLLTTVIEEVFHYFCFKTGEFQEREMMQEKLERTKNLPPEERDMILDEIERKYGVKSKVKELLGILEPEEEGLFSLLPL